MQALWTTLFYQPIYNILIFIVGNITLGDVGFAIIIVTILIKLLLSPLNKRAIHNQILMKKMEPELRQIKKDFPNKEEQARKTFELYKKYKTNPFSGCLVVLLQIPVIFALYYVFYKGLSLDTSLLYSFINNPTVVSTNFLGLIDISQKSIVFGILAGLSQFIQGYFSPSLKAVKKEENDKPSTFQDQLSESMQMNIKYILPVFIAFVAWKVSAAVALYWIVSNIFTIVQEWYIRRSLSNNQIQ